MRRLRKFLSLTTRQQFLLLQAALLLAAVRLGLSVLPFRVFRPLLAAEKEVLPDVDSRNRTSVDEIIEAVTRMSRTVLLKATCLSQALAARMMLRRYGHSSRIHIGVAKGEEGDLEAHAWLEHDGRIVIGGPSVERYAPLPVSIETLSSTKKSQRVA